MLLEDGEAVASNLKLLTRSSFLLSTCALWSIFQSVAKGRKLKVPMLSEVGSVCDWLQSTEILKGAVPGSSIAPESRLYINLLYMGLKMLYFMIQLQSFPWRYGL